MRFKTIKTGFAVRVGDKEGLLFTDGRVDFQEHYEVTAKFITEIGATIVEIKNRRTGAVAWTTFSNIVYAEPHLDELHTDASQPEPETKRGRPRKSDQAAEVNS